MPTNYNWVLDEAASAGRENLDVNHASRYDIKEDAHAIEEVRLLPSACACVVAVDVSPSSVEVVQAGFLTYEHLVRPTLCIPATRFITSLTSGRLSRFNDFGASFGEEACFGCGMSSTTSVLQNTSGTNTRRSRGCSSRCWRTAVSRSRTRRTRQTASLPNTSLVQPERLI